MTFIDGNYNVATLQTGDRVLDVLSNGNLTLRDVTVQHAVLYGSGCGAGIPECRPGGARTGYRHG